MKAMRIVAGLVFAGMLAGGAAVAADEITWTGKFVWERGDNAVPGDLQAVFTPSGDSAWDVVFNFEWEGEQRTWKGTAKGSLTAGALEGGAQEERDRKRDFVFNGSVENGVFTGEHGSMRDGAMNKLGSITLTAP